MWSLEPATLEMLPVCADIIDRTPFFEEYGVEGEGVARALEQALGMDWVYVAKRGQELAGFVWVMERGAFGRSAYVRLLAVAPERAREGVGRALMKGVEETWRERRGVLLLATDTNDPACRFYEALGYENVGTLRSYVREGVDERIYYKAQGQS